MIRNNLPILIKKILNVGLMFEAYIGWESDEDKAITSHLSYRKKNHQANNNQSTITTIQIGPNQDSVGSRR
jgi:hypothetical protein